MFITTRNKEVAEIVERSRVTERRKAAAQKAMTVIEKNWDYLRKTSPIGSRDFQHHEYSTHQKLINEFKDKAWPGSRCFIIGGGPSLKGFDFSRLSNEFTIAVNRAHEFIKNPSIIFFTDEDGFYNELMKGGFGQKALNKFNTSQSRRVVLNISGRNYEENIFSVPISEKPEITFNLKDGLYDGSNSGFAALNLAICLGAKTIYLLGYDMKGDGKGKQAWFHEGYKKIGKEKNYRDWIKHFEKIVPLLKNKKIEVVNLNPDSELKCFNFGKIGDVKDLDVKNLYLAGPKGFGDNFYLRSLIKHLIKKYKIIYIKTAIPEIYWDIPNLKFIYSEDLGLRTQLKHVKKYHKKTWVKIPPGINELQWSSCLPLYSQSSSQKHLKEEKSITKFIEKENNIGDFNFSFPLKREWIDNAKKIIKLFDNRGKKICIVRPPTVRREWPAYSRNPKMEYIQLLIDRYKKEYYFISIADIEKDEEWLDGELKGIDKKFNRGELPITTIFGLIKLTDMMIGYPGFFALAAIAMRSKCFCIFGGFQSPNHIFNDNMGLENFEYIAPEPFCDCYEMDHQCYKEIPEGKIIEKFENLKKREKYLKKVSVGVPAGLGDIHWILTKLQSFKEKNNIDELDLVIPADGQNRSDSFVRLIPFINSVETRNTNFSPNLLYGYKAMEKNWHDRDYGFGFNYLLEQGIKLADILPEYKTDFEYPIFYSSESKQFAEELKKEVGGNLYLLYGSNRGMFKAWTGGKWIDSDWVKLANHIFQTTKCKPILIGAHWDSDYSKDILGEDKEHIIYDLVSKTDVSQVLALIREANILIGFPSGLTILATHFRTPCVMFWSIKGVTPDSRGGWFKKEFMTSWVNPEVLKKGEYLPFIYGNSETTPEGVFDAIRRFL